MRDLTDFTLVGIGRLALALGMVVGFCVLVLYYAKDGVVTPAEFKVYGRAAFSLIMFGNGMFHWSFFRDYKRRRREVRTRYRD